MAPSLDSNITSTDTTGRLAILGRMMLEQSKAFARSFYSFAGRRAVIAGGLVLAAGALEGIGILSLIPLLELVLGSPQSDLATIAIEAMKWLGLRSLQAQLFAAMALFLALLVLRSLAVWNRDVRLRTLSIGFVNYWRSRIFHALAGASWSAIAAQRRTDIEHAITNDVMRIVQGTDYILRAGASLAILIIQLVIALMLSPSLTALVLIFVASTSVLLAPLNRKARKLGESLTSAGRDVHSVLGQFLSGLKLAKTHGAERRYVARFDAKLESVRRQLIGFTREQVRAGFIFQSLSGLIACILIALGLFVFATPVPVLTVILLILARLSGPFLALQQGIQSFSNMLPAFESLREMEINLSEDRPASSSVQMTCTGESGSPKADKPLIEFRDVHFGHAGQSGKILNGVSLTIHAGQLVALVGPSGAGKTTLVDILVGLLTPTSGAVAIDGKPLAGSVLASWRRDLAYVPQDPFLFDESLRDNLLWVRPQSSKAEIWQALEMAGACHFVHTLENGLEYRVGDRGQALSGGERQRICLARALLRRPRMLILDEATNAVDRELERQLLATLVPLRQRMTILIITHRLPSVPYVDRVFVLKNGRLCESDNEVAPALDRAPPSRTGEALQARDCTAE